jgi:predicted Rossmann fold nucleotide-binding protein DprA/Smf involved in DNA uptake
MSEAMLSATQFLLLLHSVPELGEKTLTRLLSQQAQQRLVPSGCLALTSAEWRRSFGLKSEVADYLVAHREALLAKSAEILRTLRSHPLEVLAITGAAYPKRLEQYDDSPPPILYALGKFALLEPAPMRFTFTTAVSNDPSPDALDRQDEIANELIELGGVPVAGHDRLPYQRLALAAQRRNRPVTYVLDRGLREALGPDFDRPPFAAARIRDAVFETERDLALSPFRLDDHGLGANNRRRDRLIFALSDVILAVSVRPGGNMAKECLRAHAQGKIVYTIPGAGHEALLSAGCPALPVGKDWAEQVTDRLRVT